MKIFILIFVLCFLTSVQAQPIIFKLTDLGLRGDVKSVVYNYFENNGTADNRIKGNPVSNKYTGKNEIRKYEFNEEGFLVSFSDRKLTYKEKQILSVIPLDDGFESFPVTYYIDSRINRIATVEREGGIQECIYDKQGKLIEINSNSWDTESSGWLSDRKTVFAYNEKGLKSTESVYFLDTLQSRTVYEYDTGGMLLKKVEYDNANKIVKTGNGLPDLENIILPSGNYTDIDMTGNWLTLVYLDLELNKSIIVERTIIYGQK